jgi:hypothetical protein
MTHGQLEGLIDIDGIGGGFISAQGFDPASVTLVTLSNGNLTGTSTSTSSTQGAHVITSSGKASGKYYFEITRNIVNSAASALYMAGIGTIGSLYGNTGMGAGTTGVVTSLGGNIISNGVTSGQTINGGTDAGNTIGIAVDLDNRTIWFKKLTGVSPSGWNETASANGYNPATNFGGVTIPSGTMIPFITFGGIGASIGDQQTANFGSSAFAGSIPSGFTAGWPQ